MKKSLTQIVLAAAVALGWTGTLNGCSPPPNGYGSNSGYGGNECTGVYHPPILDENITHIPVGYNEMIRVGDTTKIYKKDTVYPTKECERKCEVGLEGTMKVVGFTVYGRVFVEYTAPEGVDSDEPYMCQTGEHFFINAEDFKYVKCESLDKWR